MFYLSNMFETPIFEVSAKFSTRKEVIITGIITGNYYW